VNTRVGSAPEKGPAARNAEVVRQWKVLLEIAASRRGTITGLAQMCGETTRTIRRDLEAQQEAEFPLFDQKADGGVFWKLRGSRSRCWPIQDSACRSCAPSNSVGRSSSALPARRSPPISRAASRNWPACSRLACGCSWTNCRRYSWPRTNSGVWSATTPRRPTPPASPTALPSLAWGPYARTVRAVRFIFIMCLRCFVWSERQVRAFCFMECK
jgi:hypothetical protein